MWFGPVGWGWRWGKPVWMGTKHVNMGQEMGRLTCCGRWMGTILSPRVSICHVYGEGQRGGAVLINKYNLFAMFQNIICTKACCSNFSITFISPEIGRPITPHYASTTQGHPQLLCPHLALWKSNLSFSWSLFGNHPLIRRSAREYAGALVRLAFK